jgi:anti-sigma factor RsiW
MITRLYMWLTRQLVCRQAVALMSDYLEGHLGPRDVARLERHLRRCSMCAEYLAQLRVTIDALGRAAPAELSGEALDELVEVYRAWRADSP